MTRQGGLGHRLWKAFVIQAGLIAVAAILGIYAARFVLSDVLISSALNSEAEHFWGRYADNNDFPRPDTYNMKGYLAGRDAVPGKIRNLQEGIHKLSGDSVDVYIIHVSERHGRKLYLEFDGESVGELALLFGTIPLAGVLIVIYLTTWFLYRFSRRAVSPLIQLSKQVDKLDPKNTEHFAINLSDISGDADQEVMNLSRALTNLLRRIDEFVIRERNFTRDASHELRSPVTVIKIAADMLLADETLSESATRSLERIKRSAKDMEELIEALLVLARESDNGLSMENVCVNDVVREELDFARELFKYKNIAVDIHESNQLTVNASDKVLSVLIGNLVRNAFSYTEEGRVDIYIENDRLIIEDSGVGIPDEEMEKVFKPFFSHEGKQLGGYGVGLTIVKFLSDRFKWPITIESKLNIGTKVTVIFPGAEKNMTARHPSGV